jgi:3-oxoadipate enol-lactonase
LQFRLWRDLIGRDRDALARLIVLTGFRPSFISGLDEAAIAERVAGIVRGNDWSGMARHVDLDLRVDVREDAARISAPALVVGCRFDAMVPPSHARELANLIPGARYAEIDSGHIVSLESPSALLDLIEPFLLDAHG